MAAATDRPPLLAAAAAGDDDALQEFLSSDVKASALNAHDEQMRTALHLAAMAGHATSVKLLLEAGANAHARNSRGLTPLALALLGNHEAVVRALLERGAANGVFLTGLQSDSMLTTVSAPGGGSAAICPELLHLVDTALRDHIEALPAEPPSEEEAAGTQPMPGDFAEVFEPQELLVGMTVRRGPDWAHGDDDSSGDGTVLDIFTAAMGTYATVRWPDRSKKMYLYDDSKHELAAVLDAAIAAREASAPHFSELGHHTGFRSQGRVVWCSRRSKPDGPLCTHGPEPVKGPHWPCCGLTDREAPCTRPLAEGTRPPLVWGPWTILLREYRLYVWTHGKRVGPGSGFVAAHLFDTATDYCNVRSPLRMLELRLALPCFALLCIAAACLCFLSCTKCSRACHDAPPETACLVTIMLCPCSSLSFFLSFCSAARLRLAVCAPTDSSFCSLCALATPVRCSTKKATRAS